MSVQDGLDDMMGWMQGVEESVKEKGQIPLDSASLGSLLSQEGVRTPERAELTVALGYGVVVFAHNEGSC